MAFSNLPFVAPLGAPLADAGLPPTAIDLEAAHAELRRAALLIERDAPPILDLGPAARAMEAAFTGIYDALDARAERLSSVRTAIAEIDRASAAIDPAIGREPIFERVREALDRSRGHLARAEERYARLPELPLPEAPELHASTDVPRLHVIARRSLSPTITVPRAPPAPPPPPFARPAEPKTFTELRATIDAMKTSAREQAETRKLAAASKPRPALPAPEPEVRPIPPGFSGPIGVAIDDAAFHRDRARDCFEEVAMVGLQRAPLLGDPWRGSLLLERRMLASIDVIAAIGQTAIEAVPRLVADAPVKDPSRAFGVAMIMGCISGRDALAAAERALLGGDRDAAFIDEIGAAWKLVPHDLLPLALRSLLGESDPAIRALAIDVLGYRGLATPAELDACSADVPAVAARSILHHALTPTPALAGLLQERSVSDDAALREAVWTAMALTDHPHFELTLTHALEGPDAGKAALLLALAGDDQDARRVVDLALSTPTRELIFAAGWAGDPRAVGPLIDLLDHHQEAEIKHALAFALDRITGAEMWEEAEVEAEEIMVDEPPDPDVGEPRVPRLARTLGDARDKPIEPATETVDLPTLDPKKWRAFWSERAEKGQGAWNMNMRYRRGQPFTPLVSLGELQDARRTPIERRWLQRELVIRTGAVVRFDPHDLVMVQDGALRAWQPIAARASNTPGRWVRPRRG